MIVEVTSKDFSKKGNKVLVRGAKPTGALLIIKQDWCSHCTRLLPVLEEVSRKLGSAYKIMKLDGDKNSDIVDKLGVHGFPTMIFIGRDGALSRDYEGGRSHAELLEAICKESLVCKK